ncbi:MAG: SH3 domain-containing protein [Clostridiaceae bacterium]|nr:SH3 domain-containing protein [Clostridiaceae bacterium]
MYASGTRIGSLPDWYLIERETEKTIEKLNSARELDYYINNADENIRRLAVLRLKKLGLKESGEMLREIMDDPVESHANKYLAAWALKSLLAGSDNDFMLNTRYLANFTGHENYEELFPVILENDNRDIGFKFSSSPCYTAFNIDDEDSVLEKDIFFSSDFDFWQWISNVVSSLKANVKNYPVRVMKTLYAGALKLLQCVKTAAVKLYTKKTDKAPKTHEKAISKRKEKKHDNSAQLPYLSERTGNRLEARPDGSRSSYRRDHLYDYNRLRNEIYRRPGFVYCVKKGVFQLLFFLFYPIRLVRRKKFAALCILLSIYVFFAYFSYGRSITIKYAGFDLQEVQSRFLEKAGALYRQALSDINRLTGMDEWNAVRDSKQAANDILRTSNTNIKQDNGSKEISTFTVFARDGLNIRIAPDPSSDRIGSKALPYGTRVTFISSALNESTGVEWFYVEAEDGRFGWVSSKYLKKDEVK